MNVSLFDLAFFGFLFLPWLQWCNRSHPDRTSYLKHMQQTHATQGTSQVVQQTLINLAD